MSRDSWIWTSATDLECGGKPLAEAVRDEEDGTTLRAWRPMVMPSAEELADDIETMIDEWCSDDTAWLALVRWSRGEPDGCRLTESLTFHQGLRDLLAAELRLLGDSHSYEEAGESVVVTPELRATLAAGGGDERTD